jgi:tripartite-type tricarboxylate transporter receptor subunit TctC
MEKEKAMNFAAKRIETLLFIGLLTLLGGSVAYGEEIYPSKPIKVVVPFPPGGATDILTRAVTEKLAVRLGQAVVIENKPGGGANIGASAVAHATPDGYTVLMGSMGSHSAAISYYKTLTYNLRADLTPISRVGTIGITVLVSADNPAKNLAELISNVRAHPGDFTCGSSGTGGQIHLTCEMFKTAANLNILHIPYKGTAMLIPDLITGRVSMTLDNIPPYLQLIQTGKVKALAVTMLERSPLLPDVPTLAESGFPGFDSVAAYSFFVPTGTPKPIIDRLNKEVNAVLLDPELKLKMREQGIEIQGSTPEAVSAYLDNEITKWAKVIKEGKIAQE